MGTPEKLHTPGKIVLGAAMVIGVVGGGAAIATATISQSSTVSASPGGQPISADIPNYLKNSLGKTYGSLAQAGTSALEPDLILVETTDGRSGYILRTEYDAAMGANPANPEAAVAWQKQQNARAALGQVTSLQMYDAEGQKLDGAFFDITPTAAH